MKFLRVEYRKPVQEWIAADVWRNRPLFEVTGNGALRVSEANEQGCYEPTAVYSPRVWIRAVFLEDDCPDDMKTENGVEPHLDKRVACPACGAEGWMIRVDGGTKPDGSALLLWFRCPSCGWQFWR